MLKKKLGGINYQMHSINRLKKPSLQKISTFIHLNDVLEDSCTLAVMLRKLETVLKDHQLDESWESFDDFKS